ncbi:MAG: amidohydrolase family protein [Phycisphaerales bacterium]
MIFGGVLDRYPACICFAHGGGSFPGTIGRISHGHAVRPDLCAVHNPVDPASGYSKRRRGLLVHDADGCGIAVAGLIGEDRIALGSDYPFPLGEHVPGSLIESMDDLSERAKRRLLAGTALEFLGLSDEHRRAIETSGGAALS